jgi:hypothetical protein
LMPTGHPLSIALEAICTQIAQAVTFLEGRRSRK